MPDVFSKGDLLRKFDSCWPTLRVRIRVVMRINYPLYRCPFKSENQIYLNKNRQIVIFRLISLFVPVEGISRILHIVGDLWSALSKNSMKLKRKEKKKKKDQVILYATQDETS